MSISPRNLQHDPCAARLGVAHGMTQQDGQAIYDTFS
jgi:hypothetical protein